MESTVNNCGEAVKMESLFVYMRPAIFHPQVPSTQLQSEDKTSFPDYTYGEGILRRKMGHAARSVRFIKEEPPDTTRGVFFTEEN